MLTDNKTFLDTSFGQILKISLSAGFGLFGGAQLISGYWVLGLMSLGFGAIFARDSLAFVKEYYKNSDSTKNPVKEHKKEDVSAKPMNSANIKQNNQSESRHKPVPKLNFPSTGYTPLAAAESGGSTPSSSGLSRKKNPKRLSQKPSIEEIQTVRAMTEDEVAILASQPSPKQNESKQTPIKTIPKK